MRLHVLPELGDKRLVDIDRDDIRRLFEKTLPAKTIEKGRHKGQHYGVEQTRDIWKTLHIVLQDAVYDRRTARNPMEDVRDTDKPKRAAGGADIEIPSGIVVALTKTLRKTEWEVEQARWMLAVLTGIRGGEALGLTWDRVTGVLDGDDRPPRITIAQQYDRIDIPHGPGCRPNKDGQWACGVQARSCPHHIERPTARYEIVPWTKNGKSHALPLTRRMPSALGSPLHIARSGAGPYSPQCPRNGFGSRPAPMWTTWTCPRAVRTGSCSSTSPGCPGRWSGCRSSGPRWLGTLWSCWTIASSRCRRRYAVERLRR